MVNLIKLICKRTCDVFYYKLVKLGKICLRVNLDMHARKI